MIAVIGPTAVGKTKLAVRLAKHLGTEIVSADSRQLYREMRIGTTRPSPEELEGIPYHFIGCKSVEKDYSVMQYEREALQRIEYLFEKNEYVILCGGSGLYVQALCEGFDPIPPTPPKVSERILEGYQKNGITWLQKSLQEADSDFFTEVDQHNPRRLIRALEISYSTGKPIKVLRKGNKRARPFHIVKIGLEMEREALYKRINSRADRMLQEGLLDEARALFSLRACRALQTVGYKELFSYLNGECTLPEAIQLLKRNTRRYAKRQFTWFKKDSEITWFSPDSWQQICTHIRQ